MLPLKNEEFAILHHTLEHDEAHHYIPCILLLHTLVAQHQPLNGVSITDIDSTVRAQHLEGLPGSHLIHHTTSSQLRVLHTNHPPTLQWKTPIHCIPQVT